MTYYAVQFTEYGLMAKMESRTVYPQLYADRANALAFRREVAAGQIAVRKFQQSSENEHELWLECGFLTIQLLIVEMKVMG